jgi:hypothetical protein
MATDNGFNQVDTLIGSAPMPVPSFGDSEHRSNKGRTLIRGYPARIVHALFASCPRLQAGDVPRDDPTFETLDRPVLGRLRHGLKEI